MTKSYAQIVKQIEVLKQDAERARRKEVQGVVGRIKEAIAAYDLTAADLGLEPKARTAKAGKPVSSSAKRASRSNGAKAKTPAVVKFRDAVSGGTWGGRGKRPQWLRDALSNGKTLADFAVQ